EIQMFGLDAPRLTRRQAIRAGIIGATGAAFAASMAPRALAAATTPAPGRKSTKAKSVIQIWLWGGPCHIDTFDPKPGAGSDYTGPLNSSVSTKVAGMQLGELLPELAKQADKYSLLRGMTHGVFAHETASYTVQTGRAS